MEILDMIIFLIMGLFTDSKTPDNLENDKIP
jgi:hypothetical protein